MPVKIFVMSNDDCIQATIVDKALIDGGASGNVIPRKLAEHLKARYIRVRGHMEIANGEKCRIRHLA